MVGKNVSTGWIIMCVEKVEQKIALRESQWKSAKYCKIANFTNGLHLNIVYKICFSTVLNVKIKALFRMSYFTTIFI